MSTKKNPFPRSVKESKWVAYLNRPLQDYEKHIIHNVKKEIYFNKKLKNLYINCAQYDYYIPFLTDLDGNCLFKIGRAHV